MKLRIGSRESRLAVIQSQMVMELIAAADGEGLVQKMALEGIPSAVIGRTTSGKERILRNGEEVRYLDKPQMDEMYRVGR